MEKRNPKIKPLFSRERLVDSEFTYQSFRKNRYHILSKLCLKLEKEETVISSKPKILKIFKNSKFVKKLDLSQLEINDRNLYLPVFLYITKRSPGLSFLSLFDIKTSESQYKGTVTILPKYLKHLKSFHYQIYIEKPFHQMGMKSSQKIKFGTDYLRYTRSLEEVKVAFPAIEGCFPDLDGLWRFEGLPKSIKRLVFCNANFSQRTLNTSLAHLRNLKSLEIFQTNDFIMTNEAVCQLLLDVTPQLETLAVCFVEDFKIDDDVGNTIKRLTKLKKVKFQLASVRHGENLKRVLESLEDCPLKDFNLKVTVESDQDIDLITNFLMKKNDLETLKLRLVKGRFEASENINKLVRIIEDLPKLTSLLFSAQSHHPLVKKTQILPEENLLFKKLFSKTVPLKKFRLLLYQPSVSKEGFLGLVEALKKLSPTLEKLQIDIGDFQTNEKDIMKAVFEFISGLKSIRSLKLESITLASEWVFSGLIKAIYPLKYLATFQLGEMSLKIGLAEILNGCEKVCSKYGLRKFLFASSSKLDRAIYCESSELPLISIHKVGRKNPRLRQGPSAPIYATELNDFW